MKKSKILAIGLSVAFAFTLMAQESRCDVVGDSYTIGATVFGAAGGAFVDDGPAGFTFDGTTKVLGNAVLGNVGDQIIVVETQTLAADGITFTVEVDVIAQDGAGNLTTWVAPGLTTDDDADPLTPEVPSWDLVAFELASGNGGADTLDVDQSGGTYAFVGSEALLFTTDPTTVYTFGPGSGGTGASGPSGLFSGGVAFGSVDVAEAQGGLPGGESIAGFGFTWTYTITAIPEPSSAGFLLLGLVGIVANRRRKS